MLSDEDNQKSRGSETNKGETSEKKTESAITDVVKKIMLTGLGAIFMTEETIRQTISDMKLPKEIIGKVVSNANKGKEELVKSFAKEFKNLLSTFNLPEELEKFLHRHDVKVEARFSFSPKKEAE